jgi:fructokinase
MSDLISLGVDLGGTKTEAAVIARQGVGASSVRKNDDFRVLSRQRVPTGSERGYAAVLETIVELVRSTAREAGVDPKRVPIGVGMPGSVTRLGGLIKNSNTECLNGRPFRQDLARALGGRVLFDNDANCFALAEARCGAARGYIDGVVFGVIMGTGVGGGLVVRGRLWGGLQGLGGEWGHHAVGPWRRLDAIVTEPITGTGLTERPNCSCGKMGCVELYASGGGIEREYKRLSGESRRLAEIVERRDTDPTAGLLIDELMEAYGRGLANVIDILDPSAIVLGGGVSNLELLYTEGRSRVETYVCNGELQTPILRHELGDSAGVIGAALLDETGSSGA